MQNRLKEILPGIQLELFAWLPKIIQLFNKEPEVCFRYRMPKHLCFMNLFTIIEHKKPTIKTQIFKQKIRLNKRKQQLLLANDDHAPYCQQFYHMLLAQMEIYILLSHLQRCVDPQPADCEPPPLPRRKSRGEKCCWGRACWSSHC